MSTFTIATWNVNSVRSRLHHVLNWLKANPVDLLALQETKTVDENFPNDFIKHGYHIYHSGQKSYNGVALISKSAIENVVTEFQGLDDPQRRILQADVGPVRILNLYIPNGSSLGSEKFTYKMKWLEHAHTHIQNELQQNKPYVVVGDFNIAPTDLDVHDPIKWSDCIHVSKPERAWFESILDLGMTDTFREIHPDLQAFSWWDYRGGSFRRNHGLRIDFILASHGMAWEEVYIDQTTRAEEKPSDHAPVITTFEF